MNARSVVLLLGMLAASIAQPAPDTAKVLTEVDGLLAKDPDNPRLLALRGMALSELHREPEALPVFDKALAISPKFIAALRGAAQAAYTIRNPKAHDYIRRLLALAPEDTAGNAIAGVLAFEARNCTAAIEHFGRGEPVLEHNAGALTQYGQCLAKAERCQDASTQFEKALRLRPENGLARYNLALCRYVQRDAPGAVAALQPLVDSGHADSETLNLFAAAQNDNGDVPAATAALKRAAELSPHDPRNYIDLALVCLEHNAQDLAISVLTTGIQNNPGSARLVTMRGAVYAQAGQVEQAQNDFDQASRLEPDRLYGSVGLSMLRRQTGQIDSAVRILEEKLEQAKNDPVVNFLLADALWRDGIEPGQPGFARAREALNRAVRVKPDFAKAHAALGKMYRAEHNYPAAIVELQLAVRYDPHDRMALNQLVLVLRSEGRMEEAATAAAVLRSNIEQDSRDEVSRNRVRMVKQP